ncbi:thioredoxin domain-containing protein [Streptomyces caatingaensis]|uniref:DSBA oxidoreductase n=1 Tax=Streptomyces caatingaensis TaxID=1678637 RepID=A0A0K9XHG6_9ACTN|nr:thioredoxin domain-containing protein [Streptomyces caatingaensis]KNB52683.1 DSBA oxidoreductase [Streptomyces caatingaensis]
MSNRNNAQNKQAARERLRAERERQAKKDKTKRQLIVGGAVVVALAVAAGIAVAVTKMNDGGSDHWKAAAKKELVKPANTTGENGNEIVIGEKSAKETLTVFEDPRCPSCAGFEQEVGPTIRQDVKDGRYKVRIVMVNFLDGMLSGSGSKNAVSALGAALNVSPEAFLDYKAALYAEKNHPDERDDAFADDKNLLDIAQQVPALKGNKDFEKNVKDHVYDRWGLEMGKLFGKDGVNGTPTLLHGKKQLTVQGPKGPVPPMTKQLFDEAMDKEFGPRKK